MLPPTPFAGRRNEFLGRMRRLAAMFVWCSDEFTSLAAEMTYDGMTKPAEEGGLGPQDFAGAYADLDRETVLALAQVIESLLGPLTPEQRALFYRVKDSRRLNGGLN